MILSSLRPLRSYFFKPCRAGRGRDGAAPPARSSVGGSVICEIGGDQQLETGVGLDLIGGDAGVEGQQPHPLRMLVEAEERRDRSRPGTCRRRSARPRAGYRRPSRNPGLVTKSTRSTNRRFSCFIATIIRVRLAMSLPPPVPGSRVVGRSRVADERAVQIAVLVDLRAAHKADIDIAALQQQQHVGAAEHHIGAPRAALLVGRRRQFAGLDKGADRAALEQDRQARARAAAAPRSRPRAGCRRRRRRLCRRAAAARSSPRAARSRCRSVRLRVSRHRCSARGGAASSNSSRPSRSRYSVHDCGP